MMQLFAAFFMRACFDPLQKGQQFFKLAVWHQVAFILLITSQFTVLINYLCALDATLRVLNTCYRLHVHIYFIHFSNLLVSCIFRPALRVLRHCVFQPAFGWLIIHCYILSRYLQPLPGSEPPTNCVPTKLSILLG